MTATDPTTGTYVTAFPGGSGLPSTSSLNAGTGQTVANLVVLPVGPGGEVVLANAAGSTHLIIDTIGWFAPGAGGAGYVALDPPTRDLDTRTGTGCARGPSDRRASTASRSPATTACRPTPSR